jgi:arylsulfatase A-like enzyme
MSDKPSWLSTRPLLTEEEITQSDIFRRDQILTLFSLDRTIDRVLTTLKETGELDNTFILFLSDNGKFWGEHRITSKNAFYDEASRVPFAIRYPPLISSPYIDTDHVVANIDIAPTVLDLAGIPIPDTMDGLSLLDLLTGATNWREGVMLEGYPDRGLYTAFHAGRYVYAETLDGETTFLEFYDTQTDPYQMNNAINEPEYQDLIKEFKQQLDRIRGADHPLPAPTPIQ